MPRTVSRIQYLQAASMANSAGVSESSAEWIRRGLRCSLLVWCADLFCTYRPTRAKAALARVTLARMSSARAVQMNGLGCLS